MAENDAIACPECNKEMSRIKLIDRAHGARHTELQYAAEDAIKGSFSGRFPIAGTVRALMCSHCGRIVLWGESKE